MEEQGPTGSKRASTEELLEEGPLSQPKKNKTTVDGIPKVFGEQEENVRQRNDDDLHAGQIQRIYLENFMCHRTLTVDFSKHLTFVTGVKNSGKSAIAVALRVCLGSAEKSTDRGSDSSFIREDSNGPAIVKVYLSNEGPDSYRPHMYGKTIVVVRKIFKPSGGHYELLNYKEEHVTRDKWELRNILRAFNIYADNPCCVLTQEDSKKFFQGHERIRYLLFLKSTGLQRIKRELEEIKKPIEDQMKSLGDRLKVKQSAFNDIDDILRKLTGNETSFDDSILYRVKAHWEDHKAAVAAVDAGELAVKEKRERVDKALAELSAATQDGCIPKSQLRKMVEIREKIREADIDFEMKKSKFLAVGTTLSETVTDLDRQMQRKVEIRDKIKTYMGREILLALFDNNRDELKSRRARMQMPRNIFSNDATVTVAELHRALDEVNLHIAATETQIQTINVELKTHQTEKRDAERVVDALRTEVNELRTELESLTRNVTETQRQLDEESKRLNESIPVVKQKLNIAKTETVKLFNSSGVVIEGDKNQEQTFVLDEQRRAALDFIQSKIASLHFELSTEYLHCKEEYEKLQRDPIWANCDDRYRRFIQSINSFAGKVIQRFEEYVQKKGFECTLCFNHRERTLAVMIDCDNDVKQLSGGDMFYITFSLLLALGHVIECPFRLMDEYGIFCDGNVRRMTTDQLVECSKRHKRQFIVFTRNLNEVIVGKDVQIVKMSDPKRLSTQDLQQQSLIDC